MKKSLILAASVLALTSAAARADTLNGTTASNLLVGSTSNSSIDGKSGDDVLWGESGTGIGPVKSIKRVSVNKAGMEGIFESSFSSISPDGTKAAFGTTSQGLVPNDTNTARDCFVKDLVTGELTLVSRKGGSPGNVNDVLQGECGSIVFSPDSKSVAFSTTATDVIPGLTTPKGGVFIRNLETGNLTLVSKRPDGVSANQMGLFQNFSPDGRRMLFSTAATNLYGNVVGGYELYEKDLFNGKLTLLSETPDKKSGGKMSLGAGYTRDGRKVLFVSTSDLLVKDDTNGQADVFIRDLDTGITTRVSVKKDGTQQMNGGSISAPAFSPDGNWVYFDSSADNLAPNHPANSYEVYGKNLVTGDLVVLSRNAAGETGGKDSISGIPGLSPDGTKLVFLSTSSNLVANDTNKMADIFLKDLQTGAIRRVSVGMNGAEADGDSMPGYMINLNMFSADGTKLLIESTASNLAPHDTNAVRDVYVIDLSDPAGAADVIQGGQGNDRLYGVAGDDRLAGGPGADRIDGGPGSDTADYSASAAAVTIDLAKGVASGGDATGDKLVSISDLIGSSKNDTLVGSSSANRLTGGFGKDALTGGGAKDVFAYRNKLDSLPTASDVITDFKASAGDKIDLSAVDAKTGGKANDSFTYLGTKAFSGKKGQLRFNKAKARLEADINGDKKADMVIRLKGLKSLAKSALVL